MSAGLPSNDPAVKSRDISISAGDVSCQQKAERRMRRIRRERLSENFKFIRVTEGGAAPVRGRASVRIFVQLHAAFYFSPLAVRVRPPLHLFPCADACPAASGAPSVHPLLFRPCSLSVCVFGFAVVPPTPQPTDDVDIYFETPADDKEHSRFQKAKEQLEIRHRNRMERVSDEFQVCFTAYISRLKPDGSFVV